MYIYTCMYILSQTSNLEYVCVYIYIYIYTHTHMCINLATLKRHKHSEQWFENSLIIDEGLWMNYYRSTE